MRMQRQDFEFLRRQRPDSVSKFSETWDLVFFFQTFLAEGIFSYLAGGLVLLSANLGFFDAGALDLFPYFRDFGHEVSSV